MPDLSDLQSTLPVKLVGSNSSGVEDNAAEITAFGGVHSNLRNVSGTEIGTTAAPVKVQTSDGTNLGPTMDVAARAGFVKVTDGTSTQAVKAASTAAAATDPSAVVALSPNSPLPTGTNTIGSITNIVGTVSLPTGASTAANQATEIASLALIDDVPTAPNAAVVKGAPAMGQLDDTSTVVATEDNASVVRITAQRAFHNNLRNAAGVEISSASNGNASPAQLLNTQTPDTTTASTALGALNAAVTIAMAGLPSVGFQLAAGTLIGTLIPESSLDGGTSWQSCRFYDDSNSSVLPTITFGTANTLKIVSILPVGGSSHVRVRVSAYTSGTANGLMRASNVNSAAGAITSAAFGVVSNTYPALTANTAVQILAANANRKYAYISNNSGSLIVIQFGSATGLTSAAKGLVIPNNNFYELKGDNLYTGAIFAYTNSSGIVVAVTEGTP